MSNGVNKKTIIILLIAVILIGAFLRIFPVRYSSVRMCDIQLVTQAFDLGDGVLKGDFSIFKQPVKYPYVFSYILSFFYGSFYLIGGLIGLFVSAKEFTNYIFFHIDNFYDWARILMGIFGAALIPLVYIVTSKVVALKNKKRAKIAGLLAAFLMAFNLLHIHLSHQERPHILVSFFIFLSFYFFILLLEKKSLTHFLLLGLSIGLAAGSLQNGLIALSFFLLIVLFTKFKCLSSIKFWAGVGMFLIIFILCYPYLFLSFGQTIYSQHGGFNITLSGEGHKIGGFSSFSGGGFKSVIKGLLFYDPSLILILLLLLTCLVYNRGQIGTEKRSNIFSRSITGAVVFVSLYILIFGMYNGVHFRMLTPLIPFLCLFVGILFNEIFYKFEKRVLKKIFIGILILFLLFPLIQALRFNYLMFQKETRGLAKDWIENNISQSELIVIENDIVRFVPFKENLQLQLALEPDSLSRKDKFLLVLDDELYPKESRSILRYWVFKYRGNNYQFLREQKAKYVVVSKSTLGSISKSGLELEILSGGGELVESFSPFIRADSLRYSTFPDEFINPITDLWVIERMGPIIEIYKL